MRCAPFLLLLVIVCGCSSYPRRMTGQFDARHGDFIVIKQDGSLYWSPASKAYDRLAFVGIGSPDKTDPRRVRLIVPSASPFLSSSVRFSPGYSHVTVDWGIHADELFPRRETEYYRQVIK